MFFLSEICDGHFMAKCFLGTFKCLLKLFSQDTFAPKGIPLSLSLITQPFVLSHSPCSPFFFNNMAADEFLHVLTAKITHLHIFLIKDFT